MPQRDWAGGIWNKHPDALGLFQPDRFSPRRHSAPAFTISVQPEQQLFSPMATGLNQSKAPRAGTFGAFVAADVAAITFGRDHSSRRQ